MTSKEIVSLKEGDTIYVVVMSNPYGMHNPFVRKYTSEVYYKKPLRVVKTKVAKIEDCSHDCISGLIDTTPYQDLVLEGHYDNVPKGKHSFDYCDYHSLSFHGTYKNVFGDVTQDNLFLTEEEATSYYESELKRFNTNMKKYLTNLRCEIKCASQHIEDAQHQVDYFSKFIQ